MHIIYTLALELMGTPDRLAHLAKRLDEIPLEHTSFCPDALIGKDPNEPDAIRKILRKTEQLERPDSISLTIKVYDRSIIKPYVSGLSQRFSDLIIDAVEMDSISEPTFLSTRTIHGLPIWRLQFNGPFIRNTTLNDSPIVVLHERSTHSKEAVETIMGSQDLTQLTWNTIPGTEWLELDGEYSGLIFFQHYHGRHIKLLRILGADVERYHGVERDGSHNGFTIESIETTIAGNPELGHRLGQAVPESQKQQLLHTIH